MQSGLIPQGDTIVRWISPDGVSTEIHGPEAKVFIMGEGPEGMGSVEVESLFEAAARQYGETWVGHRMDHGEIDFPLHVLAGNATELRQRMTWIESQFQRFRKGWLVSYSVTTGWRWVAARRSGMKPLVGRDPGRGAEITYEVVLTIESPLAREADDTDEWVNESLSGLGQLHLYPGPSEWPSWPQFILRGPGTFRLRWAGNDVTFPPIRANEWVLINTDESRPTIRARNDNGTERNLWPEMKPGQKIPNPIRGGEVTRIDVSVTGGTAQSSTFTTTSVQHEGLV